MGNGKIIDEIDRRILNILQEDGRLANSEIARRVGMAPSAVLERIRKLRKRGVIHGYHARINPKPLGLSLTAFTFVSADEPVGRAETGEALAAMEEVQEVHYTAGKAAYLIKVRVADTEELADLLTRIGSIPTVRDTTSTIVLRTLKETPTLPLKSPE